jgi:hypothetical protein
VNWKNVGKLTYLLAIKTVNNTGKINWQYQYFLIKVLAIPNYFLKVLPCKIPIHLPILSGEFTFTEMKYMPTVSNSNR